MSQMPKVSLKWRTFARIPPSSLFHALSNVICKMHGKGQIGCISFNIVSPLANAHHCHSGMIFDSFSTLAVEIIVHFSLSPISLYHYTINRSIDFSWEEEISLVIRCAGVWPHTEEHWHFEASVAKWWRCWSAMRKGHWNQRILT